MKGWAARLACLLLALLLLSSTLPAQASEYDPARPDQLANNNLRAESAILIDQSTGEVLFEKNADEIRPPASTTKIMTVMLALLMSEPFDTVTVSPFATMQPEDSQILGLKAGEQLPMGELIRATFVGSANDGSIAIAEHIGGTEENFVNLMNEAAARYGCTNTHFANSHGYHNDNHLTTARDMAIIAREAMQLPEFRQIARMVSYTLPKTNLSDERRVSSQSRALLEQSTDNKYFYPYATGIKTGFTNAAGYCFVGAGTKAGVQLVSVVLKSGSTARWTDTARMLDFGFSQFISTSVTEIYNSNPKVINITGFSLDDADLGRLSLNLRKVNPEEDDSLVSPRNQQGDQEKIYAARTQIEFTRTLEAPITAGEVIGTMTYTPMDSSLPAVKYDLLAGRDILRRASIVPTLEEIKAYTDADPNPFPRFSLEFLIIILLPVIAVIILSQIIYKLLTRKRKPKVKQKLEYKTRYYR